MELLVLPDKFYPNVRNISQNIICSLTISIKSLQVLCNNPYFIRSTSRNVRTHCRYEIKYFYCILNEKFQCPEFDKKLSTSTKFREKSLQPIFISFQFQGKSVQNLVCSLCTPCCTEIGVEPKPIIQAEAGTTKVLGNEHTLPGK